MMLIIIGLILLYLILGVITATIFEIIQPDEDMEGLAIIIVLWPMVALVGIPMALAYFANFLADKIQKWR